MQKFSLTPLVRDVHLFLLPTNGHSNRHSKVSPVVHIVAFDAMIFSNFRKYLGSKALVHAASYVIVTLIGFSVHSCNVGSDSCLQATRHSLQCPKFQRISFNRVGEHRTLYCRPHSAARRMITSFKLEYMSVL